MLVVPELLTQIKSSLCSLAITPKSQISSLGIVFSETREVQGG